MLTVRGRDRLWMWYDLGKGVATLTVCAFFTIALFTTVAIIKCVAALTHRGCEKACKLCQRNRRIAMFRLKLFTRGILTRTEVYG